MTLDATTARPHPVPTPETEHFWEGTRQDELRLQKCSDPTCATTYFPPRPFCPSCGSRDVQVFPASGRATLASYVISHLPAPGFEPPYAIALVDLEEGPRMMTSIVEAPPTPEALELDMPLTVRFLRLSDAISLPVFAPEVTR
ncbi:Zn-ribbon domain-containing OB-fold protein [Microbacterium sp. NPDC058062]|uniref:Zn-ribbon domain-containing OB-fold protein n=1 Tax=Microbacterium sp. NPDC058062 TaxID=3346320 RepID=UPI0036D87E92